MGGRPEARGVAAVPDPEESNLGPAMTKLTATKRRFAMASVMFPFAKDWQIAKAAGYSDKSHGSLRVKAHQNFHDPDVLAAIRECADAEVRGAAMLGIATIKKIARKDDHRDQFKAGVWLAAMSEFAPAQNINVNQTVTDNSGKAIMERIEKAAAVLGIDPAALLSLQPMKVISGGPADE